MLVLATGARHAYFGHDDWERVAPGLKNIDDATGIRRRILMAFEQAERRDAEERQRLLTFVVIGGGPTGVEMAGAIAELAHVALRHDFRTINPREARIVLVEAGPRLLPAFPATLSEAARRALERLHVEVRLGLPVTHCDGAAFHQRAAARGRHIVWAAGVAASSAAQWLGVEQDRVGRVMVGPDLPARPSRDLCHRRHRPGARATASRCPAWRRSPSSRAPMWRACCARGWPAAGAAAVPLPQLGHPGDDRPARRRGRFRLARLHGTLPGCCGVWSMSRS